MGLNIKVIGNMVKNQGMAKLSLKEKYSLKESLKEAIKMDLENNILRMETIMRVLI